MSTTVESARFFSDFGSYIFSVSMSFCPFFFFQEHMSEALGVHLKSDIQFEIADTKPPPPTATTITSGSAGPLLCSLLQNSP